MKVLAFSVEDGRNGSVRALSCSMMKADIEIRSAVNPLALIFLFTFTNVKYFIIGSKIRDACAGLNYHCEV